MSTSADGSTPRVDVPPHHYAVQVIAYRSREELDAFIAEHRLKGMLTAMGERGGRTYHVLLASIHSDRASAELAATRLPAPLASITPWVRRIGSLRLTDDRGAPAARRELPTPSHTPRTPPKNSRGRTTP